MKQTTAFYKEKAKNIRKIVLTILHNANGSFNGGSLSCVDLLTVLFYSYLDYKNFYDRDMFILSKGHCSSALYATLFSLGIMTKDRLNDYGKDGSTLCVHPKINPHQGIEASSGSLGHGLALATGSVLAARIMKKNCYSYVLMGDGECNEGSVWENAAFASKEKLNHLVAIIDRNGLQGCGRDVLNYGDIAEKFRAFGFRTINIDGHNYEEIDNAYNFAHTPSNRPTAIIAKTIKGKGVSFMEDKLEWHYKSTNEQQYKQAMEEQA